MVQGAISGVRKLCAVVKEAQAAGKEVADLTSQVTGFVSKVLEGNDKLQKAEQELRINPPKDKSLQVLAFEEVSRKLELKKQYAELRNMIIYELGLPGGFWADFEATLQRMEEDDRIAKQEAELQRVHEEWQRKKAKDRLVTGAGQAVVVLLGAAYLALLLWAIRQHRVNQLSLPWG
jgi:pyruvate/oxaloacetate carboxyltransferase